MNVFFHQDVKLTDIFLTMALVGKVSFAENHIYVFDKEKQSITEIKLGKEIPYTTNP